MNRLRRRLARAYLGGDGAPHLKSTAISTVAFAAGAAGAFVAGRYPQHIRERLQ